MAIFRCKMCGGDLHIQDGRTVAICEYCGTKQTVPTADNEKKMALFSRANRLRFNCDFDQAASLYETIVAEFPDEAEAYWGLVLCKYGIEYVDDPATGKKIPTCHRTSFDNVMDDSNFEIVIKKADILARQVYLDEGQKIENLRKDILTVSSKEKPYDIFISYKEKDDNGERTIDSVLAQDIYDQLTAKGYRVFFSRISLEDKLGQEYEPYIFAALYSAKIMLVIGTDYEHFNAVWVKNEWKRYLQLMTRDHTKVLIPCYKDIDAYDLPKEFQKLQAQDLGKVGATQDLLRGIDKICGRATEQIKQDGTNNYQPIIQEGMLYEIRRHFNGPDLIEKVLSYGTKDPHELWPKSGASSQIKIDLYTRVVFNVILRYPFSETKTIQFHMHIYDQNGNALLKAKDTVTMKRGYDRLAKQWVLKGDDGSSVALQAYWALFWIDDSKVYRYQFTVTHSLHHKIGYHIDTYNEELQRVEEFEEQMRRQARAQEREKELLYLQKQEASLKVELAELSGMFTGKKRKNLTRELNVVQAQIENLKKNQS